MLLACVSTQASNSATPPTGEEVFNAFLAQSNMDLSSEPYCKEDIKLYTHFASALSLSYNEGRTTTIKSYCEKSDYESSPGKVIKVWDCKVEIVEHDAKGEFIASTIYAFNLDLGAKTFIKGSLRCT